MANAEHSSQYTGICDYYDLLMDSGYYDHEGMAKAVHTLAGSGRQILEVGVGTGLLADALLDVDPSADITGVDITPEMLDIARERLGDRAELVGADIVDLDLEQSFDIAVSSGGVWVIIEEEQGFVLGTHDADFDRQVAGLRNVARHLRKDGELLLSVQKPHTNLQEKLPGGVVYRQVVETIEETTTCATMEKKYAFMEGGNVVAEEKLHLGFFKEAVVEDLMAQGGFELREIHGGKFYVYAKRTN